MTRRNASGMPWRRYAAALALLPALAACGDAPPPSNDLAVERVVLLMRHGVRPPTKNPPLPAGIATDPWPSWPVAPGWLTPHGADAVRLIGGSDRALLAQAGVLPAEGCPAPGTVALSSNSDQRTIATGDAYLAGLAPGCGIANAHRPMGEPDPAFLAIERDKDFDAAKARAAVLAALGEGGPAAAEAAQRDALAHIDRITCGRAASACGVTGAPTRLAPLKPGERPDLEGALDIGSTAAQILLLEYADGRPMAEVGWGRASARDVTATSALHAAEFAILARPRYIAARNLRPIADRMMAALTDGPARLTLIVGHDTNLANLGGLLDLHWRAEGFAADDPPPGGALGFELLRDGLGRRFVRAVFRAQPLEATRNLTAGPYALEPIPIPACAATAVDGACPLADFQALMQERLAA